MKTKFISTFISLLFIVFVDFAFYFFRLFDHKSVFVEVIYIFIISIILLIIFLNLSYKKLFNFKNSAVKFIVFLSLFLFFSVFVSQRLLVINKLYFFTKNYKQNEKGSLWKPDTKLSYRGIPNKIGTQDFFIGDSIHGGIQTIFDSIGFRTVNKENRLNYDTLNLFLGCSFTFGSYIKAEETFSFKLSKKLKNNYINAGGSGYGMGQMLILLDSLVNNYKFKYVFIQLSPWLTDRAMQINAPFYYFYRPIPYFSDNKDSFKLNFPAYNNTSITFKYKWNETKPDYIEKSLFTVSDGFKIEVIDYFRQKAAKLKMVFGILPKPTNNRKELEKYLYEYAINKCKQNGVIPVILKLAYPDSTATEILDYLKPKCLVIDLDQELNNEVIRCGESYYKLFSIAYVQNGQKIFFDSHPNALANEIIANKILKTLVNN